MQNEAVAVPSYEELLQENSLLKDQVSTLQEQIDYFKYQIDELKRMIFGQKRERFVPTSDNQLSLFDEYKDETTEAPVEKKVSYTRKSKPKKQTPHFRNPLPAHLPRKDIILEPEGVDTSGLKKIGEEITEELEYEEAKLYVNRYIRPKYAKENGEGVLISELPNRIIHKGIAGVGLFSHIIVSKFMDHLPLYRIRKQLKRSGVDLAESTLNDWIKAIAELLEPLYNVQRARILGQEYLMVDETTIRVLDSQKKGQTHTGYHWLYYDPVHRELFYEYQTGRNAKFPKETLSNFKGYLQTDGYAGYNEVGRRSDVIQLACFAHARRKFEHALKNDKKRASWMLKRIRYLYMVERKARELGLAPEERYKFRKRHSIRQLEKMHQWLLKNRSQVVPKSAIGQAIDYTLSLWSRLRRYVEDGRLEIDNNLVENSIRPVAIGRKNYLFAGSHNGARWAAIFYTILANAELNDLEPKSYLKELLQKLSEYPEDQSTGSYGLEDLLPVNWKHNLQN
ncbi:IS66 family transposase [Calditrichota bacterium GD2]